MDFYINNSTGVCNECNFVGNNSGIIIENYAIISLVNCAFWNNNARENGGGIIY